MQVKFKDYAEKPLLEQNFAVAKELKSFLDQQTKITGQFVCDNGFALNIGIDGQIGFAEYMKEDGDSSYFIALTPQTIVEGSHNFIVTGTPSEILGKYCLPIELLKAVALTFLETGSMSPDVEWEET